MNKVRQIGGWVVGVVMMLVLFGFARLEEGKKACEEFTISIDFKNGNRFVQKEDIQNLIAKMGYEEKQLLADIDLHELETRLNDNSAIRYANVFATIDGEVHVEITQREPIMRVMCQGGESYYLDREGWLMQLSSKFTSRVPVANGLIDAPYATNYELNHSQEPAENDSLQGSQTLRDLYQLASAIHESDFWSSQISQVYLNDSLDFELIPRVGNHRIILGSVEDLESKLQNLMVFYKKGLSKTGWNEYSVINLKFKNQVVCTKS